MHPIDEMLRSHPSAAPQATHPAECVAACIECAVTCTSCADACLNEATLAMLKQCIRLNLDCADLCEATARILSRSPGRDPEVARSLLTACMQACRLCAEECQKHADMHTHCRICAEACRRCEDACRQMLAA